MKLKEIPLSLAIVFKLSLLNVSKLRKINGKELPIVVSFTSIASRLDKVHLVLRSILNKEYRPKQIILWLPEDLKQSIPQSLLNFVGDIFSIEYTHLTCSHKKLIHSLKRFPNELIVTCDDDGLYRKGWLESLYNSHKKYPNTVIANRTRSIQRDKDNNLLSYKQWHCKSSDRVDINTLPIGAEGVLYPPKIFTETVFDETLFLKLAPKADDLWFKALALSNNIMAVRAEGSPEYAIPISGTQKISLKKENVDEDKNKTQWYALSDYFNLSI